MKKIVSNNFENSPQKSRIVSRADMRRKNLESPSIKGVISILLFSLSSTSTEISTSLQISVDNNLNMSVMLTEIWIKYEGVSVVLK